MAVQLNAPEHVETLSPIPESPVSRRAPRRGAMRISIRIQLAALVLFVTLVALAISAITTWITQRDFFLANRGSRLAVIAALKAAQLSSGLDLMQAFVTSLSSRIRIQNAIEVYSNGTATATTWALAQNDVQAALVTTQMNIYSVDAIVFPASGSANSTQLMNLMNATDGAPASILTTASSLVPDLSYNGTSATQSTAMFNGSPLDTLSSILLGPIQVNDSFSLLSITLPVINTNNSNDILGFLSVVTDSQSLDSVLQSQIGLQNSGTVLVVGPAALDNRFQDRGSYSASEQDKPASQDMQTLVHFALRPVEAQYSQKRHLDYADGQPFNLTAFPALVQALQLNVSSDQDSGSNLMTHDEEGFSVSVGFSLVANNLCTWILVFEMSTAESLASLHSLQKVLIGTVFGAAGGMTLFIIPLAGWASDPLRRLRKAALCTADFNTMSRNHSSSNSLTLGSIRDEKSDRRRSRRPRNWLARGNSMWRGLLSRKKDGRDEFDRQERHLTLPGKVKPRTTCIADELTDLMTTFNVMSEELSLQWYNLEQRVRQRTIELEQSKKEAEAANESKSLFIANVSHELKTPLAGILGMCTLCQQEATDPEKIRHSMDIALKSGELLTNLLNDLLQFSKSSGKHQIVLEQKPFTLTEVQCQLEAIFDNLARQKRVPLTIELDTSLEGTSNTKMNDVSQRLVLYGDLQRLLQILINLLSNALKFSPEKAAVHLQMRCLPETWGQDGSGMSSESLDRTHSVSQNGNASVPRNKTMPLQASIDLERRMSAASSLASIPDDARERWYEFAVSDKGPGIDKSLQKQIFEPFVQGDLRLTKRFGGTGLGLSICRQLVSLMGGTITVSSEVDQGSTFTVRVPLRGLEQRISAELPRAPSPVRARHASETLSIQAALQHSADTQSATAASLIPAGAKPRLVGLSSPYFSTSNPPLGSPPDPSLPLGQRVRVLVAEDNFVNQEVVLRMLRLEEVFDVHIARNGQEALDMVKTSIETGDGYDLILMDMPILDGRESTRRIRQIGYEAPIVALSAFSDDLNREECLKSGMDNFLSKPIKRRNLRGVLDKYLPQLQQVIEEKASPTREYFGEGVMGLEQRAASWEYRDTQTGQASGNGTGTGPLTADGVEHKGLLEERNGESPE